MTRSDLHRLFTSLAWIKYCAFCGSSLDEQSRQDERVICSQCREKPDKRELIEAEYCIHCGQSKSLETYLLASYESVVFCIGCCGLWLRRKRFEVECERMLREDLIIGLMARNADRETLHRLVMEFDETCR